MDSVNFVLPNVSAADMPRDDQGALLVNQAAAIIMASYLDYLARVTTNPDLWTYLGTYTNGRQEYLINTTEVITLLNNVQDALRQF